jgi:protein involved in polysaccharide export with SLBB domain
VKRLHSTGLVGITCLAVLCVAGCEAIQDFFKTDDSRWLAADLVIKAPSRGHVDPIRRSIGPADERTDMVPNAVPPAEEDYTYREEDYVIGPTDLLDITVMDLYQPGVEQLLRREVSDAGYIDLPLLPQRIKATGLTQEQLKEAIKDAYTPNILRDTVVSVMVVSRRQNTFTIIGAVDRRGTYNILRKDMRLLEALGLAGDVTSYTVQYLYVIRMAPATAIQTGGEGNAPAGKAPGETLAPLPPPIAPGEIPLPSSAPTTQGDLEDIRKLLPGPAKPPEGPTGLPAPSAVTALADTSTPAGAGGPAAGTPAPSAKGSRWVFSNGKWVRVESENGAASPSSSSAAAPAVPANPFDAWRRAQKTELSRVIAINYKDLWKGNARMNIVVRDNDVIFVPREEVGEFYVGGQVSRPGVYSLTGRLVTVKMAVVAAGNLSPDSWPENSMLIRRIGENQEQVFPLNIEAIFRGQQSDLFLKPDDVIAVGSSIRQPFLAIFRNAFRFTYGAGFIYDRNFASAVPTGLNTERFKRW